MKFYGMGLGNFVDGLRNDPENLFELIFALTDRSGDRDVVGRKPVVLVDVLVVYRTPDRLIFRHPGKAHFVFESEKSNMHNQLLKQIQSGVKLKAVKTNDRSRPILEGLRKFRRQLTIEEQMQKAEKASVDEVVPDELDDIDAVRDDLQSTKQMLALELRNKEALERENKRLQVRIHLLFQSSTPLAFFYNSHTKTLFFKLNISFFIFSKYFS